MWNCAVEEEVMMLAQASSESHTEFIFIHISCRCVIRVAIVNLVITKSSLKAMNTVDTGEAQIKEG